VPFLLLYIFLYLIGEGLCRDFFANLLFGLATCGGKRKKSWGTAPNPRLRAAALNNPAPGGASLIHEESVGAQPQVKGCALNNPASGGTSD
jgi:hypothetical protein